MKLFTKLFILSAAVTALSSCRGDLLDTVPYDKAASNSMWSNENFCELGVAGVYSELREDYVAKRAYELEAFCVSGSCRDNDYPILAGTASIGSGLFSDPAGKRCHPASCRSSGSRCIQEQADCRG